MRYKAEVGMQTLEAQNSSTTDLEVGTQDTTVDGEVHVVRGMLLRG